MDFKDKEQIDSTLRQEWDSLWPQIAERFSTVSKSDLDAATGVDDLVARISDKSDYSENFVQGELRELCGVGASTTNPGSGTTEQRSQSQRSQQRDQRSTPYGHGHN